MEKFKIFIVALVLLSTPVFASSKVCENFKNCQYKFIPQNNFLTYYSTHNLNTNNQQIDRLVIVVHGALRNGHEYFNDTVLAAKKFNSLSNTIVLAPHFRKVTDSREKGELYWGRKWSKKWKYGYRSSDSDQISSFEVIDQLILSILKSSNFLGLKDIVITGHSAGGQFTQRYAVASQLRKKIEQNLSFVPSNPSSYMFLDKERYQFSDSNYQQVEIGNSCLEYNDYIYGPTNRASYMEAQTVEELRANYSEQKVVYLMSEEDKGTDSLDRSCEAMLQGKNRFERSQNFFHYVKKHISATSHRFISIPSVGHEHIEVYESLEAKRFIFGKGASDNPNFKYRKIGSPKNITKSTRSLFVMFGGGKNETKGMKTFLKAANGGDLLVLSGKDSLNQRYTHDFWNISNEQSIPLNSVQTISILNSKAASSQFIINKVKNAEAIFFTGGDQSKYIKRIKGSPLHKAILDKKAPIAGTSAGLAIMGEFIFSARKGGLRSRYVLKNPHSKYITLEEDFFYSPLLQGLITDTHFSERNREGRLLGFMFKSQFNFSLAQIFGVGIDEQTSLSLTSNDKMIASGKGDVWFYHSRGLKIQRQEGSLNYGPIFYKRLKKDLIYPHYLNFNTKKWNRLNILNGEIK